MEMNFEKKVDLIEWKMLKPENTQHLDATSKSLAREHST